MRSAVEEGMRSASQLRSVDGLKELACEHYANFSRLLGPARRLIEPKLHLEFASACSGSLQDLVVINAVKHALKEGMGPGFTYEYVFACEVIPWKRRWIGQVIDLMLDPDAPGDLSSDGPGPCDTGPGPCCLVDIMSLPDGRCKCTNHNAECPVRGMDVLIVSTSCKDFSKMNNTKHRFTILDGPDTPGGSVQHVRALCALMETHRPDIVLYENVVELMEEKEDGTDLNILLGRWDRMGYETKVVQGQSTVFGVAATRARLYLVAIQTRQPRVLNFGERFPSDVWDTWKNCCRNATVSPNVPPNTCLMMTTRSF